MAPSITRRTVLKGLGGLTIGLPLLEEMLTPAVAGSPSAAVPVRAFNVFFGLGFPTPLQAEGFDGPMEPLKPLADKLLIMRGVDHVRADKPGINGHFDGSSAAFTAESPSGSAQAGGPSIDQVIRKAHYPSGLPAGAIPTLIAGTYFRRGLNTDGRVSRYIHSFNEDGTVAASIQETPRELFERLFGAATPGDDAGDQRRRQSVLDTVVDQYRLYTGERSPLGARSRSRVADHLERIREYEQRSLQMDEQITERFRPDVPPLSEVPHGGEADPGGQGIDITLEELSTEWQLMADLYALAIRCDLARFGSLTFLSAGERIRLKGQYEHDGKSIFEFDDSAQLGASGERGTSHEWWHKFNEKNKNEALRSHVHMKLNQVTYFLKLLDDADSMEANGRTILENSLITISTESGDGRHNDPKRELSGIFHAITGANGRFKTGQILDVDAEGIDVYNTMLHAMGVSRRLGPTSREPIRIDAIRA